MLLLDGSIEIEWIPLQPSVDPFLTLGRGDLVRINMSIQVSVHGTRPGIGHLTPDILSTVFAHTAIRRVIIKVQYTPRIVDATHSQFNDFGVGDAG